VARIFRKRVGYNRCDKRHGVWQPYVTHQHRPLVTSCVPRRVNIRHLTTKASYPWSTLDIVTHSKTRHTLFRNPSALQTRTRSLCEICDRSIPTSESCDILSRIPTLTTDCSLATQEQPTVARTYLGFSAEPCPTTVSVCFARQKRYFSCIFLPLSNLLPRACSSSRPDRDIFLYLLVIVEF
jgi:hypothetical protein